MQRRVDGARREQAQAEALGEVDPDAKRPMHVRDSGDVDGLAGIAAATEIRIEHVDLDRGLATRELGLDVREDLEQRSVGEVHETDSTRTRWFGGQRWSTRSTSPSPSRSTQTPT